MYFNCCSLRNTKIDVSGCSVGHTIRLGAHDEDECDETRGCLERIISRVWHHEDYDYDKITNDITIAQYMRPLYISI